MAEYKPLLLNEYLGDFLHFETLFFQCGNGADPPYQSLENYTIFFNPSLSVVNIFASIFEKIQFKDYIIASLNSSDSLITFKLLQEKVRIELTLKLTIYVTQIMQHYSVLLNNFAYYFLVCPRGGFIVQFNGTSFGASNLEL